MNATTEFSSSSDPEPPFFTFRNRMSVDDYLAYVKALYRGSSERWSFLALRVAAVISISIGLVAWWTEAGLGMTVAFIAIGAVLLLMDLAFPFRLRRYFRSVEGDMEEWRIAI